MVGREGAVGVGAVLGSESLACTLVLMEDVPASTTGVPSVTLRAFVPRGPLSLGASFSLGFWKDTSETAARSVSSMMPLSNAGVRWLAAPARASEPRLRPPLPPPRALDGV